MPLFHVFFQRCFKALLPFLVLVSFTGFAQQDILKKLVETKTPEKLIQLEYWCNKKLFFHNPSRKIELLNELEQIAHKKNDKITLASIIFYRGLYVLAMDSHKHKKGIAMMQKAIAMAEKNSQKLQAAYFKHSLGYFYFIYTKNPAEALENMLQAHYTFEQTGYQNIPDQSGMLDRLGFVYYHFSNFNQSIKYFKQSLKNPIENSRRHIGILNSIGQSYRELFEPDSARTYFKLSLQKAITAKDTAWIGINSGDLGWLYINERSYTSAKSLMQEYYKCGLATKNTELVIEALTGLGDISLNSGNIDQALQQLKQAETLSEETFKLGKIPMQNYVRQQRLYSTLSKAWDAKGNAARSLNYIKEANKIRDSIESRAKLSKNVSIQQMFEAEQTNNQLKLLEEEKQAAEMKQIMYISIGVLLAIIIALLYSRQIRERKIQKQRETLLNIEKEITEKELRSSQEQLEEYVRNLRLKAKLLEKAQTEIDLIKKQNQFPVEDKQAVLHKLSFATILTEDDWTKFRMLFEKAHSGFFQKLKTTYPGLTPAETRLCSLIKLEINSHQMAAMMGISSDSIKKNRQRLRKKINLSKEQKLDALFIDF